MSEHWVQIQALLLCGSTSMMQKALHNVRIIISIAQAVMTIK